MNLADDVVAVLDFETTDFLAKGGLIVEIGIAGLHLPTGKVFKLFDSVCREPGLNASHRDAWIFNNSTLTPEEVRAAPLLEDIRPQVQRILSVVRAVTAFNKAFDFGFLRARKFNIPREWECPMLVSTHICKIGYPNGRAGHKWPKVEEAWGFFFPLEPYVELHRGYDDAAHEAKILYHLYKNGYLKEMPPGVTSWESRRQAEGGGKR